MEPNDYIIAYHRGVITYETLQDSLWERFKISTPCTQLLCQLHRMLTELPEMDVIDTKNVIVSLESLLQLCKKNS